MKTSGDNRALDQASLSRAQSLVGLKGYVTNVPAAVMPAAEVIAKYHDLWHVEKSFRMSKSDPGLQVAVPQSAQASRGQTSRGCPRAVDNLALQALVAAFAADKPIVDESSARTAIAEVTAD